MARVGAGLECLVEEDLRTAGAVGAVVELSGLRRREPGPQSQDRHELVVVPLGRREVGDTDADVVNESCLGHLLLLPTLGHRGLPLCLRACQTPARLSGRIRPFGGGY